LYRQERYLGSSQPSYIPIVYRSLDQVADLVSSFTEMLSTASRDGSIRIWDRRVRGYAYVEPEGSAVGTVNHIKNAHGAKGKNSKGVSILTFPRNSLDAVLTFD